MKPGFGSPKIFAAEFSTVALASLIFVCYPFSRCLEAQLESCFEPGVEQIANSNTQDSQEIPKVAMDGEGRSVVVWHSNNQDGSGWGVYFRLLDESGAPIGFDIRANTRTTGDQWYPDVACNPEGTFVIAWNSVGQDGDGGGIYARRFDSGGKPLDGIEFAVNTFTLRDQGNPAVAINETGDFVIAWDSNHENAGNWDVYWRAFLADGTPLMAREVKANEYLPGDQWAPSVGLDSSGNVAIVWMDGTPNVTGKDGNGAGVYGRCFVRSGEPRTTEFQVHQHTAFSQWLPRLAMSSVGDFAITWSSWAQDEPILPGENQNLWGVYARCYSKNCAPKGDEFRVNTEVCHNQYNSRIAMAANGSFIVTWQSHGQATQDRLSNPCARPRPSLPGGIFAQIFSSRCERVGAEFRVDTYGEGDQIWPSVAVNARFDFTIAWESNNQDGSQWACVTRAFTNNCNLPERRQLLFYDHEREIWGNDEALFSSTTPTCVIVHGWNCNCIQTLNDPDNGQPHWTRQVARAVHDRLGGNVNVLAWDWLDLARSYDLREATACQACSLPGAVQHRPPGAEVLNQADLLAGALTKLLREKKYLESTPIHLMGHSLGAHTVAWTGVRMLQLRRGFFPRQVTCWDPPEARFVDLALEQACLVS